MQNLNDLGKDNKINKVAISTQLILNKQLSLKISILSEDLKLIMLDRNW